MTDDLVAIESYPSLAEANVARIHLEENGIPAFVSSHDAWQGVLLDAGFPVYVREKDVERARSLLTKA